jgi:hypothetical protein
VMVHHGDASTAEVQNAAATKKEVHTQLTVLFKPNGPFQRNLTFTRKQPKLFIFVVNQNDFEILNF